MINKFAKSLLLTSLLTVSLGLSSCKSEVTNEANTPTAAEKYSAGPALWLVKDEDTAVYLFGTMHVLKPNTNWQTPEFEHAFTASDVIYQEADVGKDVQRKLAQLIPALAFYSDGRDLMEVLDADDEKEVLEAAAIVGMPPEALQRMKPWFAALGMTQMQMVKSGFVMGKGVETIIDARAEKEGKPIRYLETAEQQLRMLAELPEDSQIEFLVAGAIAIEDTPNMIDELADEWVTGDVAALADMISDVDATGDRIVYDAMFTNRNQNWVKQINTLMDKEVGTFLFAVGAGHLAGDDSVIAMLRQQGETVIRQ